MRDQVLTLFDHHVDWDITFKLFRFDSTFNLSSCEIPLLLTRMLNRILSSTYFHEGSNPPPRVTILLIRMLLYFFPIRDQIRRPFNHSVDSAPAHPVFSDFEVKTEVLLQSPAGFASFIFQKGSVFLRFRIL